MDTCGTTLAPRDGVNPEEGIREAAQAQGITRGP
jgi:hypothetical protein